MKKEKGITLIALVITIVVLLILAAVGLSTIIGDDGILSRAKSAKERTSESAAIEKIQIEYMGSYSIRGKFDKDIFIDHVKKNLKLSDSDIKENIDGSITVTIDDYKINVKDDGKITSTPSGELSEESIIFGNVVWNSGKASINIGTDTDYTLQYQINGIVEENWLIAGSTITELNSGDTVYARLTNGEQASNYKSLDINLEGSPKIEELKINEITTNSITVQITTPGESENCVYKYYINGTLIATATMTNLTDLNGNTTKKYSYSSNYSGKSYFDASQPGPYGVLKYISLTSGTNYSITIQAFNAVGEFLCSKSVNVKTK